MELQEAIRKSPVTVSPETTITETAKLMDERSVGAVVIVDDGRPVGIVTDRDMTVRATARRYPPDARVDSVMSTDPITVRSSDELRNAFDLFDANAIRRLPLVDDDGALVGMVTADDLLMNVASDLGALIRPITGQVLFAHPEPGVPAVS